ncbi:MAG: HIRAN domain-containing protein [Propionicimonas sp.]
MCETGALYAYVAIKGGLVSAPGLVELELWSRNRWANAEVAGASFHEEGIRKLFPKPFGSGSRELTTRAALVPEPSNKHDRNAVMVVAGGQHVGYLAKEVAPYYQPIIERLRQRGFRAVTDCTIYAYEREDWLGTDRRGRDLTKRVLSATVRIVLDEWWMCVPANLPPNPPHVQLPQGSALQARKEENHQASLRPLLRPEGEAWAYATLHVVSDLSTRTPKDLVELRIDGQRVGELTPMMSSEYIPIIRQLEEVGRCTAARVIVKGNHMKADVVLYAAKTGQLDAQWIAANVPKGLAIGRQQTVLSSVVPGVRVVHPPIPPKPSRIQFNPAPGWPLPPAGWEPQPGWVAPGDWPSAPPNWTYWVAAE